MGCDARGPAAPQPGRCGRLPRHGARVRGWQQAACGCGAGADVRDHADVCHPRQRVAVAGHGRALRPLAGLCAHRAHLHSGFVVLLPAVVGHWQAAGGLAVAGAPGLLPARGAVTARAPAALHAVPAADAAAAQRVHQPRRAHRGRAAAHLCAGHAGGVRAQQLCGEQRWRAPGRAHLATGPDGPAPAGPGRCCGCHRPGVHLLAGQDGRAAAAQEVRRAQRWALGSHAHCDVKEPAMGLCSRGTCSWHVTPRMHASCMGPGGHMHGHCLLGQGAAGQFMLSLAWSDTTQACQR
mmetsp:Transcript_28867/g.73661  ORF Transcript_28867/g.73661 Transcript_28867/m.73661 type:complete len:294 (-) Transcript_28867:140-1021(-)